jgi:diacylglycerol kinase (ATP)
MGRIIKAFINSLRGIKSTYQNEKAFRQEVCLSIILIPLTLIIPVSLLFKGYLLLSLILVLLMEIANSAIEATVDMVTMEFHELAKRAKDMGSAIVLIALIHLFIAWFLAILTIFQSNV